VTDVIDLNTLLPEGSQLTPLFPKESEYREFRARYTEDIRPKLDRLDEARRKSEEDARKRLLD
jgi:hypothetical protein